MTGFVQVATDGAGKQLDNDVVQFPAGSTITAQDGSTFVLAAPAYYYRERIVNADPSDPVGLASVRRAFTGSKDDYGVVTRSPENNPDLDAIKFLLTDIDNNIQSMAFFATQPQPSQQLALPLVGGLQPAQFTPTVPRPIVSDVFGRQVVLPHATRDFTTPASLTITASTSETTLLAGSDPTVFNDLAAIILTNTSATVTEVQIKDTTGGTTVMSFEVPPTDTRGLSIPGVLTPQTTAGKNWTATCGTSVTSVKIFALFVKNRSQ